MAHQVKKTAALVGEEPFSVLPTEDCKASTLPRPSHRGRRSMQSMPPCIFAAQRYGHECLETSFKCLPVAGRGRNAAKRLR